MFTESLSALCVVVPLPPFSLFPLSAQLKLPAEKGKRVWILLHMCNNFFRTLKYQKYPENRVSLKKSQRRGPPGVCATRKIGESDTLWWNVYLFWILNYIICYINVVFMSLFNKGPLFVLQLWILRPEKHTCGSPSINMRVRPYCTSFVLNREIVWRGFKRNIDRKIL